MVKIYTKNGDQGQTQLVGGDPVSKADPRLDAYGGVDELNSSLGLALCSITSLEPLKPLGEEVRHIQNELFTIGSQLACADANWKTQLPCLHADTTLRLESSIDRMTSELPPLREFILPGGSEPSSRLHLARTICRRAERAVAHLFLTDASVAEDLKYLNRLSDYLFIAARWSNHQLGIRDETWKKP